MAQSAIVNGLISSLITSLTGISISDRRHKQLKEHVIKGARHQQYVRVNQFEVESSLNGLVEKFQVLDRDDLAEALTARLDELSKIPNKWTPDILSLFLNLSDRPVEKFQLEALYQLRPFVEPEPSPFTWEELLADEPFSDPELWENEPLSAGSSDDEVIYQQEPRVPVVQYRPMPVVVADEPNFDQNSLVTNAEKDLLRQIEESHHWNQRAKGHQFSAEQVDERRSITVLQAIRQVCFMLRTLPTSMFYTDVARGTVIYNEGISLIQTTHLSVTHVLASLADIGSALYRLREWLKKEQVVPLLQSFQAAVSMRLQDFDKSLSTLEREYATPSKTMTASILAVHDAVQIRSRIVIHLEGLVSRVSSHRSDFTCMELLYDDICVLQDISDSEVYEQCAHIFFECLRVYLRPIRAWMELGDASNFEECAFISVADKDSELSALWHSRFELRRGANGDLLAPLFIQSVCQKILNAGKSIVFLDRLGKNHGSSSIAEPLLDFDSVCHTNRNFALAPFSELFATAFADWVRSRYGPSASILREQIFTSCGLWRFLDALELIYFGRDGSLFQSFASEVFRRMDERPRTWNDRFLLSEVARSTFGGHVSVEEERISARTSTIKGAERSIKTLSSLAIDYNLPWPVLNVIQKPTLVMYHRVQRLLLQTRRAKSVLASSTFPPSPRAAHHATTALRLRLTWLVDVWQSYLADTVLRPATLDLRTRISAAEDLDAMSAVHDAFATRVQAQCLLAKNLAPILDALLGLFDLAAAFAQLYMSAAGPVAVPDRRVTRRQHAKLGDVHDSESEDGLDDDEREYDADTEDPVVKGGYEERVRRMLEQFGQQVRFVVAGLRSAGRVGGEGSWEVLAERLEWDAPRGG
ncbi:hypothetical protein EJ06DRAFT_554588 [Trichodelitschia bisporula]|uniref:Spindle pole body component n=1 Tax=Trichodelitschia bisporula TaxID=703511 RepID=A0A6G1I4Z7_9PEZI|nr:hypothetical protein EJ06DRAFT_554588 [Trichodelitschia bisporula]